VKSERIGGSETRASLARDLNYFYSIQKALQLEVHDKQLLDVHCGNRYEITPFLFQY
jgi:hypothetical protein